MAEAEPEPAGSGAGQRLGAPETLGISTLDPGHRPPAMPPGQQVTIRVRMLDDTEELFDISQKASGKMLLDLVCSHMNLIEGDYFGLEFQNHQKMMVWLDHIKPIIKQLRRPKHTTLRFAVKFFPPDHTQLLEELTRYLFALQIKQDLSCGRLTCNDTSAALLVSHIIQSEIGDFEESQCRSHLLNNSYIPDQMPLIDKIMEFHSKHIGQTPAESDYHLLEVARRLEMYGIRLHPAKDREGTRLSLSVAHTGVLVFQGHTKINAFNWAKVRKVSFKRKRFLIKLRPDLNQSSYQDTLEFLMASRDCCKVFWKICVEYHAFFRLFEEPKPKPKPVLFSRGSSFRFSGRTQKQVIDYVRESEFKKIPFERKHSRVQYSSRVQNNSRLSPLPSPRHHEVPEHGAPVDRVDSPRAQWKESVLVSAEDPSMSRITRASPYHHRNGHDERAAARAEELRSPSRNMEASNIGPACRPTKTRATYIPFSDCIDFDYNISVRPNQSFIEQRQSRIEFVNETQQENCLGGIGYREPSSKLASHDFYQRTEDVCVNNTVVLNNSRERDCSSPVTLPMMKGAKNTNTITEIYHQTSMQNGYSPGSPNCDETRYSTTPKSRSLKSQNHSHAEPTRPTLSRAERLAVLERRMVANGLSAPGRPRPSSRHRRRGQRGGAHMGALLMHDGSPTSCSESSESEMEQCRGNAGSPVMFGNPRIPRSKFSFGSLQLDEGGGDAFSDDDFEF